MIQFTDVKKERDRGKLCLLYIPGEGARRAVCTRELGNTESMIS